MASNHTHDPQRALETVRRFHGSEFLRAINRGDSSSAYGDLKDSLERLTTGVVRITNDRYWYVGHLLSSVSLDKEENIFRVRIDEDILVLFGYGEWTKLYRRERQALQGKNLALWLHGYYASHPKPYPVTVAFLHKLSGSRMKELRNFKPKLKKTFRELAVCYGYQSHF